MSAEEMATLARASKTSVLRNSRHPSNCAAHPVFSGHSRLSYRVNGDDREQALPPIDGRFSYREHKAKQSPRNE